MDLIHYGQDRYIPELFQPIKDEILSIKPKGGLWTSPLDSVYGWFDWCQYTKFCDLSKHFCISISANNILTIDSVADLDKLAWRKMSFPGLTLQPWWISFEEMALKYDAIHLTDKGQHETRLTRPRNLNGWDCESVLLLSKDIII